MALRRRPTWCCAGRMFVRDEVSVDASFAAACRRLSTLMDGSALVRASHGAWGEGLARVGLASGVPGLARLVNVQFRELALRSGVAVLTLRWQAAGASGGLFPALDADLTLIPNGENAALLGLEGVYGPPAGALGAALDRAVLHRIGAATTRSFLSRIAQAIADVVQDPGDTQARFPPHRRMPDSP
jgi:hypothetical protein